MIVHKTFFTHDASTHRRLYTEQFLHGEAFACGNFYIETLPHRRLYAQCLFYRCTQKFLPRHAITHIQTPLHAFFHREFLKHRRLVYTKQVLQREPPTHRCFYTQKLLYGEVFTQRNLHTELKCLRIGRIAKGFPTAAAL